MKYIKPFNMLLESASSDRMTVQELYDIMSDITDDGHSVELIIGNRIFQIDDLDDKGKIEKFNNYMSRENFGIRIEFGGEVDFSAYVDILNILKPIVGRFVKLGHKLVAEYVGSNISVDNVLIYESIDLKFSNPFKDKDGMTMTESEIVDIFNRYGYNLDYAPDYDQDDRTIIIYYKPKSERYPNPSILANHLNSIKIDMGSKGYDTLGEGRVKFEF